MKNKYTRTNRKNQPSSRALSRRTLVILAIVLLLLIGAGFAFLHNRHKSVASTNTSATKEVINYSPPTDAEKQEADAQKVKEQNPQPNPTPVPAASTVVISSAKQDGTSKDVVVQTQLYGTGWRQCHLTLTHPGSAAVTKDSDVIYQQSFSICMGFSIKSTDFPAAGTWTATLTADNSDGSSQKSSTVNVDINL
jgi:hypothetical protein